MRKLLLCSGIALLAAGCGDGGSTPSVATAVTLSPEAVSLNALGATQVVHATVTGQNGEAIRGAAVSWASSSGAVTIAGAGGDSAIVTAVSNGSASITAQSGGVSAAVTVQVAQTAAVLQKTGGDAQTGVAATPLPQPVSVGVRDRRGGVVAGATVDFTVSGGGTLSAGTATTGENGDASVVWTLGTTVGTPQQVVATSSVGSVEFSATVAAAAPATAVIAAGNNQRAPRSAQLATTPRVQVLDAHGNAVRGVVVHFAVTSGGGSVGWAQMNTDDTGSATPGSWRLGATIGANTLTATFPGTALPPVVFTATAANAGAVSIQSGQNWAAMAGTAIPVAPRVVVHDGSGNPLAGMQVTFTASSGGSVASPTAITSAGGVASAGAWTLGPDAGPNTLTASVAGITGAPAVFRGTGCTGGGGAGYALTLCYTTPLTATQRAAFQSAADRWSGIITADLPDVVGGVAAGDCGDDSPNMSHRFDDLLIFAGIETIDGPSGILGQAGWCYLRDEGAGLPLLGLMTFDMADMNSLEASGQLNAVILHEMGHVMGIGTLWSERGLLQSPSGSAVLDTWFSGAQALIGFDAIGGSTYTGGQKVPVENTGGVGTVNGHWRETVLWRELMTGYVDTGLNPLSVLTVRSLADLGYTVDVSRADPFSLSPTLQAGPRGPRLDLGNDIWNGPRFTMDRQGRKTRIPRR
ncbi:leishmanolysin-related zinc metalloendopeptidase [Longimicrobium sp.]|uniref:leishmanolysin-related zinc metalloendopeptidase n=1 Tax=Longimicrobium sp. TaxID=2029185 RepID=UPI003B3AD9C4